MLVITDSGTNVHLSKQATTTMVPVIIPSYITSMLTDSITMELSHIATLQIPGIIKQARQIRIFPKIRTAPLTSLRVLYFYGCTITIDKQ